MRCVWKGGGVGDRGVVTTQAPGDFPLELVRESRKQDAAPTWPPTAARHGGVAVRMRRRAAAGGEASKTRGAALRRGGGRAVPPVRPAAVRAAAASAHRGGVAQHSTQARTRAACRCGRRSSAGGGDVVRASRWATPPSSGVWFARGAAVGRHRLLRRERGRATCTAARAPTAWPPSRRASRAPGGGRTRSVGGRRARRARTAAAPRAAQRVGVNRYRPRPSTATAARSPPSSRRGGRRRRRRRRRRGVGGRCTGGRLACLLRSWRERRIVRWI